MRINLKLAEVDGWETVEPRKRARRGKKETLSIWKQKVNRRMKYHSLYERNKVGKVISVTLAQKEQWRNQASWKGRMKYLSVSRREKRIKKSNIRDPSPERTVEESSECEEEDEITFSQFQKQLKEEKAEEIDPELPMKWRLKGTTCSNSEE